MTEFFDKAHQQDQNQTVSLLAQDQYMREMRWIPLADRQEEAQCLKQIKQGLNERKQSVPDQHRLQIANDARTRMVETYQQLIVHEATSFARCHSSFDLLDFVNEGNISLLTLLDRLDAYEDLNGASFHGLAMSYIRGAMLAALRDRGGMVRLPVPVVALLKQIKQVERNLYSLLEREPTASEIAQEMQMSLEKVVELLEYRQRRSVESVECLLDREDADEYEYLDFVNLFQAHVAAETAVQMRQHEAIHTALTTVLTPKQQEVVRVRYGFDEEPCELRTYPTVAAVLGVTTNVAFKRDGRAIERLSHALASVAPSIEQEQSA